MTKQGLFPESVAHVGRTWLDMIESTKSPEEVLVIARDYLDTWDPLELAALPSECKPPDYFFTPDDIVNYAFALVQHHCGPGAGEQSLSRLANFFSQAARQVAFLMSHSGAAGA